MGVVVLVVFVFWMPDWDNKVVWLMRRIASNNTREMGNRSERRNNKLHDATDAVVASSTSKQLWRDTKPPNALTSSSCFLLFLSLLNQTYRITIPITKQHSKQSNCPLTTTTTTNTYRMLDEMEDDLEAATTNLNMVTLKTKELIQKSGGKRNFIIIVMLSLVVVVLLFLILYS